MSETERKVSLWLAKGRPLTRNDLADFLAELDAAGASGDTVVEARTNWVTGMVRGLFATPVTRGDPVPLPDPAADWEALARGDDSRPPFPGRSPDWYHRRPAANPLHPGRDHWAGGPSQCVTCFMLARKAPPSTGPLPDPPGPFDPAPRPDQVQPSMTRDDDGLWA